MFEPVRLLSTAKHPESNASFLDIDYVRAAADLFAGRGRSGSREHERHNDLRREVRLPRNAARDAPSVSTQPR